MPSLEHRVPGQSRNSLEKRAQRAERLLRYLRATEPAQIALALRRECRMMEDLLGTCLAMGVAGASGAAQIRKCLIASRSMMLELLGVPKRPGRRSVDDRILTRLEAAIPEEIIVEEPASLAEPTCDPRG